MSRRRRRVLPGSPRPARPPPPRRCPSVRTGPGSRARGRRPPGLPVGPARRRRRPTDRPERDEPVRSDDSGRPEMNDPTPIPRSDADRSPFEPDPRPTGLEPIRGARASRTVVDTCHVPVFCGPFFAVSIVVMSRSFAVGFLRFLVSGLNHSGWRGLTRGSGRARAGRPRSRHSARHSWRSAGGSLSSASGSRSPARSGSSRQGANVFRAWMRSASVPVSTFLAQAARSSRNQSSRLFAQRLPLRLPEPGRVVAMTAAGQGGGAGGVEPVTGAQVLGQSGVWRPAPRHTGERPWRSAS